MTGIETDPRKLLERFDPEANVRHIIQWARQWFRGNGDRYTAVIGISGGKDSTITAALLKEALGRDRVLGILIPDGAQPDLSDAVQAVRYLGIPARLVNIQTSTHGVYKAMTDAVDPLTGSPAPISPSGDAKINTPPRIRMSVLYAVAASLPEGGRVANTCNRSETYIGYSTKNGDDAGDFSLLLDYLVCEILDMGDAMGLPKSLVHKTPSDGLCGKSDEDRFGFTYATLDRYLLAGKCENEGAMEKINCMHAASRHKTHNMPFCPKL